MSKLQTIQSVGFANGFHHNFRSLLAEINILQCELYSLIRSITINWWRRSPSRHVPSQNVSRILYPGYCIPDIVRSLVWSQLLTGSVKCGSGIVTSSCLFSYIFQIKFNVQAHEYFASSVVTSGKFQSYNLISCSCYIGKNRNTIYHI